MVKFLIVMSIVIVSTIIDSIWETYVGNNVFLTHIVNFFSTIFNPNFLGAAFGSGIAALVPIIVYLKEKNRIREMEFLKNNVIFRVKFYDFYQSQNNVQFTINNALSYIKNLNDSDYERIKQLDSEGDYGKKVYEYKNFIDISKEIYLLSLRFEELDIEEESIPWEVLEAIKYKENGLGKLKNTSSAISNFLINQANIEKLKKELEKFKYYFESLMEHYDKVRRVENKYKYD